MARVKCYYCKEYFDREKEECIKVNQTRYAHKVCYDKNQASTFEEDKAKKDLEEYIKKLFGYKILPPLINTQLKRYIDKKYTYKGILQALVYFYEVKNGDINKAKGGIGIVDYCYDQARNYYLALWEAKQKNEEIIKSVSNLNEIIIPTVEIHIVSPKRIPIKQKRKLFSFLERSD